MKLVVDGFGKSVAKRDNQIVIKENGKEVDYFRAEDVSQILLTGKGSITFDALTLLANHDIDCVSINWKGYVDYRLTPPEKKNVIVKKEQFFALADKRSGQIAKAFINAKIENQKAVLGTLAKSRSNDEFLTAQRDKLNYYLDKLDGLKKDTSDNLRSKALLDIGQYDKCINLSTEALLNLSEFAYDNDVWFKWRIAKSFNQLGEYDQSVDYLNDIKQFKNDWFIDNLMAENYFFKNDLDNALKYASSAALAKGDTDKKVNLYSLIEDILNKKNKQNEADIHAYLVYTIRKRHNWNIDENLEYKIEKAGFDLDNKDYFTIEKHLHHLWEEYLYKNQELKKGVIVSVLPNKKAGFIRCDEYPDNLYFSMNEFKHNITLAKTGQNVTFYEADGFDKKKNKQVKNAVNIYLNGG